MKILKQTMAVALVAAAVTTTAQTNLNWRLEEFLHL